MEADSNIREAARLRDFWNARYKDFSLRESGISHLPKEWSEFLYLCKERAYEKALKCTKIDRTKTVSILDVGCGQGYFAAVAKRLFADPKYRGIDISESAIRHLAEKFPEFQWACEDICRAEARIEPICDLAQSIEVLHLILDDGNHRRALGNLAASLRVGGWMIVTDTLPTKNFSPIEYIVFRPRSYYDDAFREFQCEIVAIDPMYYWVPDQGPRIRGLARLFRQLPARLLYRLDRALLALRAPQFRQSHDSQMKMIVCRKRAIA